MKLFNFRHNSIVTRFPPSPTGWLHVGSVRAMLFNYLFAKQHKGTFRLRIEDTDKERSKKEYEDYIYESMKWLGIPYDAEVFRQSDRSDIYKAKLKQLIDSGHAYISKETPKEEGQRTEVIRFKNPKTIVTFDDMIRGPISFDTTELGDFVIAKSIDEPLYHLAVVVDDIEMGVTHVIRGEDHISNTPRQILILEAFGAKRPIYAHLPLILATDKSKLSKRKHGQSVAVLYYRDQGFLPETLINFMALLGWNPGTDQEIFTLDELIKSFSFDKVQKSGAVFNVEKLRWMNKEHMKRRPQAEVDAIVSKGIGSDNPKVIALVKERIETYGDIATLKASGEFDFVFSLPSYDVKKLIWKDATAASTTQKLTTVKELLGTTTTWNNDGIKKALWDYAEKEGKGSVLWPLRYALSGKDKSPDPFMIADIVGKEETLARIDKALGYLHHA